MHGIPFISVIPTLPAAQAADVNTWLACMALIATRIAAISEVIALLLASLPTGSSVVGLFQRPANPCGLGADSRDRFCVLGDLDAVCASEGGLV